MHGYGVYMGVGIPNCKTRNWAPFTFSRDHFLPRPFKPIEFKAIKAFGKIEDHQCKDRLLEGFNTYQL